MMQILQNHRRRHMQLAASTVRRRGLSDHCIVKKAEDGVESHRKKEAAGRTSLSHSPDHSIVTSYSTSMLDCSGASLFFQWRTDCRNAGRPTLSSTRKIHPWLTLEQADAKSVRRITESSGIQVALLPFGSTGLPHCARRHTTTIVSLERCAFWSAPRSTEVIDSRTTCLFSR